MCLIFFLSTNCWYMAGGGVGGRAGRKNSLRSLRETRWSDTLAWISCWTWHLPHSQFPSCSTGLLWYGLLAHQPWSQRQPAVCQQEDSAPRSSQAGQTGHSGTPACFRGTPWPTELLRIHSSCSCCPKRSHWNHATLTAERQGFPISSAHFYYRVTWLKCSPLHWELQSNRS